MLRQATCRESDLSDGPRPHRRDATGSESVILLQENAAQGVEHSFLTKRFRLGRALRSGVERILQNPKAAQDLSISERIERGLHRPMGLACLSAQRVEVQRCNYLISHLFENRCRRLSAPHLPVISYPATVWAAPATPCTNAKDSPSVSQFTDVGLAFAVPPSVLR